MVVHLVGIGHLARINRALRVWRVWDLCHFPLKKLDDEILRVLKVVHLVGIGHLARIDRALRVRGDWDSAIFPSRYPTMKSCVCSRTLLRDLPLTSAALILAEAPSSNVVLMLAV